jgi:hypothetical protein
MAYYFSEFETCVSLNGLLKSHQQERRPREKEEPSHKESIELLQGREIFWVHSHLALRLTYPSIVGVSCLARTVTASGR